MRVIAGEYRGFRLDSPKGDTIRPTTDRIKEDLFNIINLKIEDSVFLDLFSGTGSIGIEALSRGSKKVILVDSNKDSIALIKKNLTKIKCPEKYQVICSNAEKFLLSTADKYDIIFLDPPYKYENVKKIMEIADARNLVREDGLLIIEQGVDSPTVESYAGFTLYKTKKYSSTLMYYLKRADG